MNHINDERADVETAFEADATDEQLGELRRLGVCDADLDGLTATDAEEWIDELQTRRRDADRFGPVRRQRAI